MFSMAIILEFLSYANFHIIIRMICEINIAKKFFLNNKNTRTLFILKSTKYILIKMQSIIKKNDYNY